MFSCNNTGNNNGIKSSAAYSNQKILFDSTIHDTINLTGQWHRETKEANFDLDIIQTGDSLKGTYCAVAANGKYLDCPDSNSDGDCMIIGCLEGNSAKIIFNSSFSNHASKDTATIIYNPQTQTLSWVWKQKNIVSYAPEKAILKEIKQHH